MREVTIRSVLAEASPFAPRTTPSRASAGEHTFGRLVRDELSAPKAAKPPVGGLAVLASPVPPAEPEPVAKGPDLAHRPTPEEIFGESPFMANPIGMFTDYYTGQLRTYGFNPMYFATEEAAQILAGQLGGTVVARNAICNTGYFFQAQPNYMVQLPNGLEVNAGIIADFYNHGYPQSYVDRLIAREIDPQAGYDNLHVPVTSIRNGVAQPGAYYRSYSSGEAA